MTPHFFFHYSELLCWLVLLFYWLYMWNKVKPDTPQPPAASQYIYRALLVIGFVLFTFHSIWPAPLSDTIIPRSLLKAVAGLGLTILGVALAIWSRKILADNWSAQPTVREGHELIQRGPYQLTRHPIYTGIIIAALGTAIIGGQVRGFVAFIIIFIALWYKSTFEEKLMRQEFPDQYHEYAKRVKRLIPGVF